MAKARQGGCYDGGVFLSAFTALLTVCFLLRPSTAFPSITMEKFSVSALRVSSNSSNTINFDLELRNLDVDPIYYDALNLTFYYKSNLSNIPIGNSTFSPFYQRKFGRDHRVGNIVVRGAKWENATAPQVVFRVELASSLRYQLKGGIFKSKRLHYVVGADLKVNNEGNLVNKGVELKSRAGRNVKGGFEMVSILMCMLFILHSL